MKYDLTRCNNLNFRRGYNTGFLKVNEGKAYRYSYKKEWAVAIGAERHYYFGRNPENIFEGVVIQFTDFRY